MGRRFGPWLLGAGWAVSLGGLAAVGLMHVWGPVPDKDFSLFYQAARHWLAHGEPGGLAWYHPFALRALSPLGRLGSQAAGTLWVGMNLACLVASARLVGEKGRWWRSELWPLLLMASPWFVEFFVNQFVPPILLLLLLGERALLEERPGRAGFWLGLAILLKLSPAVLLLWLLVRREGRALGSAVGVVLLCGPGLDLLTAGWKRGLDWQWEWYQRVRFSGSASAVLVGGEQCDYANHALAASLRRLLHPTESTPLFDVAVGGHHELAGAPPINLVNLPIPAVTVVWGGLMLLGLGALVRSSWQPRRHPPALRWEFALYMLGMLWFLPVVRAYHYIWAYPLVSLLTGRVRAAWHEQGRLPWRSPALSGLGVWVVTMSLGVSRFAQEVGLPMLGITALGVAGLWELARVREQKPVNPSMVR